MRQIDVNLVLQNTLKFITIINACTVVVAFALLDDNLNFYRGRC